MERSALGKGLSALIPEDAQVKDRIQNIPIDKITASRLQPRSNFNDERIGELAESIREKGVIQPILVRPSGDRFELIAGERRFRAAQKAELKEVPAIVKRVEDGDLLELSLIENIQREELTKIEEARAYRRLSEEFGMTHETISKRVSKDRATVTNTLRLLDLPAKIQKFLEENTLTMGHARCLLTLGDEKKQLKTAQSIVKKGLSVRQTESLVKRKTHDKDAAARFDQKDVHIADVESRLQYRYGTRVKIHQGKKRGKIEIDFFSSEDLNRILTLLLPEG